jgi:hypothetical protein
MGQGLTDRFINLENLYTVGCASISSLGSELSTCRFHCRWPVELCGLLLPIIERNK